MTEIPGVDHLKQSETVKNFYWTKERWEGIIDFKKNLKGDNQDPLQCPYLSREVALSWVRSQKSGVSHQDNIMKRRLTTAQYWKVLNENSLLINITRPLIDTFKEMAVLTSGYIVYLCNVDGVFLLQEGEMMRVPTEGLVWNENTIGTCAHSLCIDLKRPICLLGPEHYSLALTNIMASAAPIFDESGKVMATLILGQPLNEHPWGDYFSNLHSHTLGLITSLAGAVEAQMKLNRTNVKLKESYDRLSTVNNNLRTAHTMLETTLSLIDEGIITLEFDGKIINFNQEGARILKLASEDIGEHHIQEFLNASSNVMAYIKKGKNVDLEEPITAGNDEHTYLISIRPIINKNSLEIDGAILKLTHSEKINALVASRSGSMASYKFEEIIGENNEFKETISLAKRFARSPDNILITGESGTGKELFAQSIHNIYRPKGPFMVVNCAALPRELIESELFGYEGGSFTGAERSGRPGKIELAHGGTLFLDEIGDMPLELQAIVLRTLEDKQVMRIGGRRYKKVDFRLIAATNKDLYKMVRENLFREDLYFRLSVLNICIKPLRERKDDIPLLCRFVIESYCRKLKKTVPQISAGAQKIIYEYQWPGNVRQLQNAMIYAVNSTQDDIIKVENLPGHIVLDKNLLIIDDVIDNINCHKLNLEELERTAIEAAMLLANQNIYNAADILGIGRSTLYRKLKDYKIKS